MDFRTALVTVAGLDLPRLSLADAIRLADAFVDAATPLDTHEGMARWLLNHPEAYKSEYISTPSRIAAIKAVRNAAREAGTPVGLLEAKQASEHPSIFPNHPVVGSVTPRV